MNNESRTIIRIGRNTLAFANTNAGTPGQAEYTPYPLRSGVAMAVNLREAFAAAPERITTKALVLVETPVMFVPIEEFDVNTLPALYQYSFCGYDNDYIDHCVVPNLNAVAAFAVNKDIRLVLADRFGEVEYMPVVQPVMSYLHRRGLSAGSRLTPHAALYAYLHDGLLDVFCFNRNRIHFYNRFEGNRSAAGNTLGGFNSNDASYFLLYVWKLLGFDTNADELYLSGDIDDSLRDMLHRFVQHVYAINPSAEFNRAPITQIQGLPFDLMTLFMKGR